MSAVLDTQLSHEAHLLFEMKVKDHIDWDGHVDRAEKWSTHDLEQLVRLANRILESRKR